MEVVGGGKEGKVGERACTQASKPGVNNGVHNQINNHNAVGRQRAPRLPAPQVVVWWWGVWVGRGLPLLQPNHPCLLHAGGGKWGRKEGRVSPPPVPCLQSAKLPGMFALLQARPCLPPGAGIGWWGWGSLPRVPSRQGVGSFTTQVHPQAQSLFSRPPPLARHTHGEATTTTAHHTPTALQIIKENNVIHQSWKAGFVCRLPPLGE